MTMPMRTGPLGGGAASTPMPGLGDTVRKAFDDQQAGMSQAPSFGGPQQRQFKPAGASGPMGMSQVQQQGSPWGPVQGSTMQPQVQQPQGGFAQPGAGGPPMPGFGQAVRQGFDNAPLQPQVQKLQGGGMINPQQAASLAGQRFSAGPPQMQGGGMQPQIQQPQGGGMIGPEQAASLAGQRFSAGPPQMSSPSFQSPGEWMAKRSQGSPRRFGGLNMGNVGSYLAALRGRM